ncbi:S9 family peptidase [Thalassobacillus hwangdonensis]|uniref:S9 family peptidase n=1 Tax=Thalassobacillus hwangdonensis TaxID=546108 RepID=A0ABW3KZM5_9BACI
MSKDKRTITKEDLFEIRSITNPVWSPDGKGMLTVITEMDKEADNYFSNLFHYDKNSRAMKQWTFGKDKNFCPKWSPDGESIAFISTRSDSAQLYLLPVSGGEAEKVTDLPNGITNFIWSPDGKKLAVQASLKPDEGFDSTTEKKEDKKDEPSSVVIDRMKYKADGSGLLNDQDSRIALFDLHNRTFVPLTDSGHSYHLFAWSPDGNALIYAGDEAEDKDFSFNSELFLHQLDQNERIQLHTEPGYISGASWSPNGQKLAVTFHGRTYENATHADILLFDMETDAVHNLTEAFEVPIGDFMSADVQQGASLPGIIWQNEESLYFTASQSGSTVLYFANLDGEIYPAWQEDHYIYGYDLDQETQTIAATVSTPTSPGELYMLNVPTGETEQLTTYHADWLDEVQLSIPESFVFKSVDSWDVQGWIMKPANFEEGKKYPLVYQVHGGPHMMYGYGFMHEMQLLAANGYAVAYINPRGSQGYNQAFVDAVRGDYGGKDYQDIMNGLDYILECYDFIDEERLGLTGGSYGGFMTNWIIGHTGRFKTAVTQRCISNWISFYGVSDIGYYFSEWQIKAELDDIETLWRHSPIAYVDDMNTPLLIIHSENDHRCPIEQSEQLFIAMKRKGKTAQFVRVPDADHNLSRSGKPSLRLERLDHITRWFEEKL